MAIEYLITVRALCAISKPDDNGPRGCIVRIPRQSRVRVCGASSAPNLVEIEWQDAKYAVFKVDLRERAVPLRSPDR